MIVSSNSPIIQIQESKVDVPVFCLCFVFAMSPYLIYYRVRLQFLFDGANIRIIPETCKHFGNYFDYEGGDCRPEGQVFDLFSHKLAYLQNNVLCEGSHNKKYLRVARIWRSFFVTPCLAPHYLGTALPVTTTIKNSIMMPEKVDPFGVTRYTVTALQFEIWYLMEVFICYILYIL